LQMSSYPLGGQRQRQYLSTGGNSYEVTQMNKFRIAASENPRSRDRLYSQNAVTSGATIDRESWSRQSDLTYALLVSAHRAVFRLIPMPRSS
jgi:hypothetical protein